jgi:twitching motility two-component system response regulator PilH
MALVLVVDDVQSEAQLIGSYLQAEGHSVTTAINAEDALLKMVHWKPDVIVTDLVMPGMSGLEFCRQVKKNPETTHIPIIACTTKNRSVDIAWAKKQGITLYIVKPFSRERILEALDSVTSVPE